MPYKYDIINGIFPKYFSKDKKNQQNLPAYIIDFAWLPVKNIQAKYVDNLYSTIVDVCVCEREIERGRERERKRGKTDARKLHVRLTVFNCY